MENATDQATDQATDKPTERLKSWPWGIILALLVLLAIVSFVVWQMAFFYGSRRSNDLLMASPDATREVIQLRAQLEEVRSYQTTLLTVVLASFGAGFTVLVVVNFAVLFIAQRNYDREEKRMREFLIIEAERRDAEISAKANAELQELANRLEERIKSSTNPLRAAQKELRGMIGSALEHSIEHYHSMAALSERIAAESASRQRQGWEFSASEAERAGAYAQAASYRSRILQSELGVPGGMVSWSNLWNIIQILESLEKIDESKWVLDSTLNTIAEALTAAQNLDGMDEATANEIARGIGIIEAIRERQSSPPQYFANAPLTVPGPRLIPPPTGPLRVPIPEPPTTSDE